MNQRECVHKEILLGRYIVKDTETGGVFHICKICWDRMRRFKGYILIESGGPRPMTEAQRKAEAVLRLRGIPF